MQPQNGGAKHRMTYVDCDYTTKGSHIASCGSAMQFLCSVWVAAADAEITQPVHPCRHFATAMAQAKSAKKRHQIWAELLRTLADDLVPDRPGRREPRAVKRRPKPYPLLNKPRHQFREILHRSRYKRIT